MLSLTSQIFSTPRYLQANGQIEAVNKTIKDNLKKKLEDLKGVWIDELPKVLWSYHTTVKSATGKTPFSLCYSTEVMILTENGLPSYHVENLDGGSNSERLRKSLNLIDKKREPALSRIIARNRVVSCYYNSNVREQKFEVGDLVLKKVQIDNGIFGPN